MFFFVVVILSVCLLLVFFFFVVVAFFGIVVFSYLVCLFILVNFIFDLFVSWFPFMSLMCFLVSLVVLIFFSNCC